MYVNREIELFSGGGTSLVKRPTTGDGGSGKAHSEQALAVP
jgi:hypothetical protein